MGCKTCGCFRLGSYSLIRFRLLCILVFAAVLTFGCSTAKQQIASRDALPAQERDTLQVQPDDCRQAYKTRGGEATLRNLTGELAEEPEVKENEFELQSKDVIKTYLRKTVSLLKFVYSKCRHFQQDQKEPASSTQLFTQVERCHKEELAGMLWLSVPEPRLIEDPLLEDSCAENASVWCDPDFEDVYLAYLEQEKRLKLEVSIFPNFVSPVDNGLVLRGMQLPSKKRRGHYGLDIIPASWERRGVPIKAVEDGVIIKVSRARGYGYYTVIYHQNGLFSLYSHLLKNTCLNVGQQVHRGEAIAQMGKSGNARGYHLHFELIDLRENWDLEQNIDTFVEDLCCHCVKKQELNQFSKLLFNKKSKKDPLPSIPGLALAKKVNGKWVAAKTKD